MYKCFQNILTAQSSDDASKAFDIAITKNEEVDLKIRSVVLQYPNWISYLKNYWLRKESWCLAFRDATTHGHQTNNFSEVNVRLYKDIVLSRNKAYNAIALVDFTCTSMEEYYLRRLRTFVNERNAAPRLFLQKQLAKASYVKEDHIKKISNTLYKVASEKTSNVFYEVDCEAGFCSCVHGRLGNFCKHQGAIYFYYDKSLPNAPAVRAESYYAMAKLAFGNNVQPASFYMPMQVLPSSSSDPVEETVHDVHSEVPPENIMECEEISVNNESGTLKIPEEYIAMVFELMTKYHANFGTSATVLSRTVQRLKKIKTQTSWEIFLSTAGSCVPLRHRHNAHVKVQTTSISRRRPGVTKGSKRLPIGRPAHGKTSKNRKKRKRNLALAVKCNQPDAKSHGVAH